MPAKMPEKYYYNEYDSLKIAGVQGNSSKKLKDALNEYKKSGKHRVDFSPQMLIPEKDSRYDHDFLVGNIYGSKCTCTMTAAMYDITIARNASVINIGYGDCILDFAEEFARFMEIEPVMPDSEFIETAELVFLPIKMLHDMMKGFPEEKKMLVLGESLKIQQKTYRQKMRI